MKQKKTYFMRTFQIVINLILLFLILVICDLGMNTIHRILLSNTSVFMWQYFEYAGNTISKVTFVMDEAIMICVGITMFVILPEVIYRITRDSMKNWVLSIYHSLRIRKYVAGNEADILNDTRKKVTLSKSVIEIRNKSVSFSAKLTNDLQAHKKFIEMKDILYKEVVNLFPEYSFSQIERHQQWVSIEGTRIKY